MKTVMLVVLAAGAFVLQPALAETEKGPRRNGDSVDSPRKGQGKKRRQGPRPGSDMHKKLIEKFDADGDGKLSESEREEAKKAHRERMLAEHDKDGDGTLSDEERAAAKEAYHAKMKAERIARFDKDGDGELSEAEREAAKDAHKSKMKERMLKRFDEDGDGQLSEEERAAAKAAREKHGKRKGGDKRPDRD